MSATPIVPGLLYQVRHRNTLIFIFARNPVDALTKALMGAHRGERS